MNRAEIQKRKKASVQAKGAGCFVSVEHIVSVVHEKNVVTNVTDCVAGNITAMVRIFRACAIIKAEL
jgi:hypothetical protein